MKNTLRTVAMALSPLVAVQASLLLLQAASLPFPPEARIGAWPDWLLFMGLVFVVNAALVYGARRLARRAGGQAARSVV